MAKTLTAPMQAAIAAAQSEIVHLLELNFSGGAIRFTSGPHNVTFSGNVYSASGSAMTFTPVAEVPDFRGQRLRLILDGVSLGAVAALLAQDYIGREGILRRAHVGANGLLISDPIILFRGLMNAPWEVIENIDAQSARVETDLIGPLAMFDQLRGITADQNSHQAQFPGDTFFSHITTKPEGDFGWGVSEKVPIF